MSMYEYHGSEVKDYPNRIADLSDADVLRWITEYQVLTEERMRMRQFRQYRRLLIREALKRGLISKDPGGAP